MTKKICKKCGRSLGLDRFEQAIDKQKRKRWRRNICRKCRNRPKILQRRRRARRYKRRAKELFGDRCSKCGYNKCEWALEFHHRSGRKEKEIAYIFESMSWEKILKELKGCELLCANCHREVHCNEESL